MGEASAAGRAGLSNEQTGQLPDPALLLLFSANNN